MAIDPVCGMEVAEDAPLHYSFEGITYHFCSENCLHKFRDDPHQYLKQVQPATAAASAANTYICPMHPEVVLDHPGNCPKCGMALEVISTVAMGITRPLQFAAGACALMLAIYFGVVGLISGMDFALDQFAKYWYFILLLAFGFGVQVGLYIYLKNLAGHHGASGKVVAVSGTTSTAAMVSCCAHYLTNILPMLGVTGFLAVVAEYQIELFWLGLAFNAAGVMYVLSKVVNASREHQKC
ncbi:MAG TPA: YHS domain-containing protein [Gallionellaceae bacterium]|nr:YHS domain-containing protein [Gallionellaceae bacterium]